MPVKFGLWRLDGESAQQVRSNVIASEERLERIIQERLDILGLDDLFQIGRQVITDFGKRIDLLAIDGRGDLSGRTNIATGMTCAASGSFPPAMARSTARR
jgi:hypothetical protein